MKTSLLLASFFLIVSLVRGQEADSVKILESYTVYGYLYKRALAEAPASVGILVDKELERFNNVSVLPVMNTIPGVRMEERSPGSYRLSIRGSSIRSPFGVRNVKVYWNGLPLTDGGGNTYLNLFDFSSIRRIEIIKGPGGSLYGAGTGGVVLLNATPNKVSGVEASSVIGSYGLKRFQLRGDFTTGKLNASLNLSRQNSKGYRDQSEFSRDVADLELNYSISASTTVAATLLHSDIFYETPGGLTLAQYLENPKLARPAAVDQNANVKNRTTYAGLTGTHDWNTRLSTNLGLYYSNTDFRNLAVTNYEVRDELNAGMRMENTLTFLAGSTKGKISFGTEYQMMDSPINVFENIAGNVGSLTISDDLRSAQSIVFLQTELDLPYKFFLTAGGSISWLSYDFKRQFPETDIKSKDFSGVVSPRVALLRKVGPVSFYGSASKGFSPPTLAEVRPSTNQFNSSLFAEKGISYEAGIRGAWKRFSFDVTQYFFLLKETIVLKRDENGSEFFVNAGKTRQIGSEVMLSWKPTTRINTWGNFSYNHYRFSESGKKLTGAPPIAATLGLDVSFPSGLYFNSTFSYTDKIPLNDENTFFSDEYFLVGVRAGYRKKMNDTFSLDLFASIDNALDQKYSLGNDLNSAAQVPRFFNPAPGRNFSVGVKLQIFKG